LLLILYVITQIQFSVKLFQSANMITNDYIIVITLFFNYSVFM